MIRLHYKDDTPPFLLITVIFPLNISILKSSLSKDLRLKFSTNLGFEFSIYGCRLFFQLLLFFIKIILKPQSLNKIFKYYHILAYIQNYQNLQFHRILF